MKLLHVISPDGKKLFSGTKHDCKLFVRKNRINKYQLKSTFTEKVVAVAPQVKVEEYETLTFNSIFDE